MCHSTAAKRLRAAYTNGVTIKGKLPQSLVPWVQRIGLAPGRFVRWHEGEGVAMICANDDAETVAIVTCFSARTPPGAEGVQDDPRYPAVLGAIDSWRPWLELPEKQSLAAKILNVI